MYNMSVLILELQYLFGELDKTDDIRRRKIIYLKIREILWEYY